MPGGLKFLVLLEEADLKRSAARHTRAMAGAYSVEHDWVQTQYEVADKLDREATELRAKAYRSD